MVELWTNAVRYNYVAKTNEPGCEDTMYQGVQRKKILGEFGLEQMILQYEQVTNACMKPIHLQILDAEHVLLANAEELHLYGGLALKDIKECCVDLCLVQTDNKREVAVMGKMIKLTRQDLTSPQPSDGIYKHMKPKGVVVK